MQTANRDPDEHPECRYCSGFLTLGASGKQSEFNALILESPNFVVVPTLGHFIPGWCLIVPRLHYACMGALETHLYPEFLSVKSQLETILRSIYGDVIQFEHGPCSLGTAGACVDHAHLHMVPTRADIGAELSSRFMGYPVDGMTVLASAYRAGRSYLFYENNEGESSMYDVSVLPSQYMRMLLAQELGMLERYDWRSYSGREELRSFLQLLEKRKMRRPIGELLRTS
jgi:diadenosine tetraphosphate (Ap4A) HIT family hydrolase